MQSLLTGPLLLLPFLIALLVWLLSKGGRRGRVLVVLLVVILPLGEALVIEPLKAFFARERPLPGVFEGTSMPSAHAAHTST